MSLNSVVTVPLGSTAIPELSRCAASTAKAAPWPGRAHARRVSPPSMSRIRLGISLIPLLAVAVLACIVLGPAAARTQRAAKYGGTLVVGLSQGDPTSLDPTLGSGSFLVIAPAMCQRLYTFDAKQQLAPLLA